MSSKFDEITTTLIGIVMEMGEINEKVNKMNPKEMDAMITSALSTSKRTNSTMKKILDMDTQISTLRQQIGKASLQAMITTKEEEDPRVEEKPKVEEKTKVEEPPKVKVEEKPKIEETPKAEEKKGRSKAKVTESIPVSVPTEVLESSNTSVEEKKKGGRKKKEDEQETPKVDPPAKETEEKKKKTPAKKEIVPETPKVEEPSKPEESTKKESDEEKEPLHIRRKNIPKHVKTLVWGKFIGNDKPVAKCFSCRHENIDIRNFHCGHVVAESKGGTCTLDNLRPICAPCNGSMGVMSMNEFTTKYFGWSV